MTSNRPTPPPAMHKIGSIVTYEREQALRTGEQYSGKGKIIGTYRVYVIVDVKEMGKPAPYTSAIHEGHVEPPPPPNTIIRNSAADIAASIDDED